MKKRLLAVVFTGALAIAALSTSVAFASESETESAGVSVADAGGFTEYPIFEDAEPGDPALFTMNAVYFQAVPMTGGYEDISDYNIHIEADIHALQNTIGFGVGDWIPYLQVSYEIKNHDDGSDVASGNFMPMSADDGPHYGQNISLDPGTYDLTISVSPQEDVYLIHTDSETGPGGTFDDYFADGPLSYTYEGWEFAGLEQ